MLIKLDADMATTFKSYYSTYQASAGTNLRTSLTAVANQLDADTGLSYTSFASDIVGFGSDFISTQEAFNVIILDLNNDPVVYDKTYLQSTGTVVYEILITNVNTFNTQITLNYEVPLVVGPIILYKQIPTSLTWAPHHFGDPSMVKHVSESTILYENADFSAATLGYSSDLSPGFDTIPVVGEGTGAWGSFNWGSGTWGGLEDSRPTRTYVPVNKQRCRFINGEISHNNALELFYIYGISYTFSPISNRAYR
jgi:hypothetical protein